MDKTTKFFDEVAENLMSHFKRGWPEYAEWKEDDYPSILQLSEKIADKANVSIDTTEGFERVTAALFNIAVFCKYHEKFADKNLHFYNRAFQTLYNSMRAAKRFELLKKNYSFQKRP